MAKLVAVSPFGAEFPIEIGTVTLTEVQIDEIWSVAPFRNKEAEVSEVLKAALGIAFPAANRTTAKAGARAIWAGAGRALVAASSLPELNAIAAVTRQGDGIAALVITGEGAEAVLARLVPLDLRIASFKKGHTARTMVNHMMANVTRIGPDSFEIMVMRSMGQTLLHELREAAEHVAARG